VLTTDFVCVTGLDDTIAASPGNVQLISTGNSADNSSNVTLPEGHGDSAKSEVMNEKGKKVSINANRNISSNMSTDVGKYKDNTLNNTVKDVNGSMSDVNKDKNLSSNTSKGSGVNISTIATDKNETDKDVKGSTPTSVSNSISDMMSPSTRKDVVGRTTTVATGNGDGGKSTLSSVKSKDDRSTPHVASNMSTVVAGNSDSGKVTPSSVSRSNMTAVSKGNGNRVTSPVVRKDVIVSISTEATDSKVIDSQGVSPDMSPYDDNDNDGDDKSTDTAEAGGKGLID